MQVEAAITEALTSGLLTDDGKAFLQTLTAEMRLWQHEQIPDKLQQIVAESIIAHRTYWRVRNLAPTPEAVAELAAHWTARTPLNTSLPTSTLVDQHLIPDAYRRLPLPHLLGLDGRPASVHSAGDAAYLDEDWSEATVHYLDELRTDPIRPQPWAGLVLALPKLHPDTNFTALREHVEVVAHLYRAVRLRDDECDIVELARWLSRIPLDKDD